MSHNYEPDGVPEVSLDFLEEGRELNLQPVNVICDETDAKVGDQTGVSFMAMTPFLPRTGDEIHLQDGGRCRVKRVYFGVTRFGPHAGLVANVYATRVGAVESCWRGIPGDPNLTTDICERGRGVTSSPLIS